MSPFRPRLKFSLRTLLVVVTVLCGYLGWQWRIVHERKAMLFWIKDHGFTITSEPYPSPLRNLLGDEHYRRIYLYDDPLDDERKTGRVQRIVSTSEVHP